jgi:hypothetical protein
MSLNGAAADTWKAFTDQMKATDFAKWGPGPGTWQELLAGQGHGSFARLFRQIRDLGYDGSYSVVRNYLDQHHPAKTPLPGLSSFAKGLEQDLDAVTNGRTMPWSSGPVEGREGPHQDDQAPDVRPRRTPTPPQARLAHRPNLASGPKPGADGRPTAAR